MDGSAITMHVAQVYHPCRREKIAGGTTLCQLLPSNSPRLARVMSIQTENIVCLFLAPENAVAPLAAAVADVVPNRVPLQQEVYNI